MTHQVTEQAQGLEQLIQQFNRLTLRLTDSYSALEDRFKGLAHDPAAEGRSAARLQSILNVLPVGIVLIDGSGCVAQCNPAAENLLGQPLLGEVWRRVIERAFDPRSDDGHDVSLRNGRVVSLSTTPLAGEPGQILVLTDVSSARDLQRRLSMQQRLSSMGQMAASLAHQVRTPLASAVLYASRLKDPRLDTGLRLQVLDKLMARMRHLDLLVRNILIFARGGTVGDDHFSTGALLAEAELAVESCVLDGTPQLEFRNEAPDAMLRGNRELLVTSLQNLANNALRAMEGQGRLALLIRHASDDAVDVIVEDEGPGIASELHERVFDPFFTTHTGGTGLGLAVVKAIVQAHGGAVWLESGADRGCRFILRLPVAERPTEQP